MLSYILTFVLWGAIVAWWFPIEFINYQSWRGMTFTVCAYIGLLVVCAFVVGVAIGLVDRTSNKGKDRVG